MGPAADPLSAVLSHPQFLPALGLALWVGGASTALSWWLSWRLAGSVWQRQAINAAASRLPLLLAMPHLAFAVGVVMWLAPTGWLSRFGHAAGQLVGQTFSLPGLPGLTGDSPPQTELVQDPWGLALMAALVLKELPFLLWLILALMRREDLRRQFLASERLALTLGWTSAEAFRRLIQPALAPRLRWAALAVLVYGCSVVDMALVLGPTRPPTLAVLVWQWLNDADPSTMALGQWAGVFLGLASLGLGAALWAGRQGLERPSPWRDSPDKGLARRAGEPWLVSIYALVGLSLLLGSVTAQWPYPQLWPETWTLGAWRQVLLGSTAWGQTLLLGVASASWGLLISLGMLALLPPSWRARLRPVWMLTLWWPVVLWVTAVYEVALWLRIEGTTLAVVAAHALIVTPYVLLSLEPGWQALPAQLDRVCAGLGQSPWRSFWRVKLPLLRPALAAAWAIGFAVSVAQYLPTAYVGAGRWQTVTTEAVTLAAGGQRASLTAFALMQAVLPALALGLAALVGRPRRFRDVASPARPSLAA